MNWIWFIIIGIVAGYFAGLIMKGGGFGIILNLILGVIGGLFGGWILGALGLGFGGILGSLLTAVIGAILLLWIASWFQRKPSR